LLETSGIGAEISDLKMVQMMVPERVWIRANVRSSLGGQLRFYANPNAESSLAEDDASRARHHCMIIMATLHQPFRNCRLPLSVPRPH